MNIWSIISSFSKNFRNSNAFTRDYYIISLGNNCLPRHTCTVFGIKPTKEQGELSYPFDLCVTPGSTVKALIETNFKGYYNGIEYNEHENVWVNKLLGIYYNHDKDCGKKDLRKLKYRFKNRIKNFRKILKTDKTIYFVLNNPDTSEEVNLLYEALRERREEKRTFLIVLDPDQKLDVTKLNHEIFVFNEKHPFDDINNWWIDENKEKLNQYTNLIGNYIKEIIERKYNCIFYKGENK